MPAKKNHFGFFLPEASFVCRHIRRRRAKHISEQSEKRKKRMGIMEKIAIRPFHEKYPFAKRDKRSFPQLRLFTPPQHVSISPLAHRSSFHFPSFFFLLFGQLPSAEDNGCKGRGNNNASSSSSSFHRMSVGKESQFLRQQYFLQQRKKEAKGAPPFCKHRSRPRLFGR